MYFTFTACSNCSSWCCQLKPSVGLTRTGAPIENYWTTPPWLTYICSYVYSHIYIFIPITIPCSTAVTTTNYPLITFIHFKLLYLGWWRVARDWWMEKLNMKKEMLSLYSEFLFNWIIMLAGPRSTYLQIKTFHILIPYCHRLSAGTFLVVPRCCRRPVLWNIQSYRKRRTNIVVLYLDSHPILS